MAGIPAKRAPRRPRPTPAPASGSSTDPDFRSPSPSFSIDSQTVRLADENHSDSNLTGSTICVDHHDDVDQLLDAARPGGLFLIHMPGGGADEPPPLPPRSARNHVSKLQAEQKHHTPRQQPLTTPDSRQQPLTTPDSSSGVAQQDPKLPYRKIAVSNPCDSSSDSEPETERESWMCREFEEDDDTATYDARDGNYNTGDSRTAEDGADYIADLTEPLLEIKRRKIADEILDTEDTHINVLFNLTRAVWKIDGANKKSPFLKDSEFRLALPDIDPLYKVHSEHIRPALAKQLEEWEKDGSLAQAFITVEPMLKMYRSYVPALCMAASKLSDLRRTCQPLANLLSIIEGEPRFGKLPMQAHMSSLFQRLLRYRLLMQKYVRYTVVGSKERNLSEDVLRRIEKIIDSIENDMKHKENFAAIFNIQLQLEEGPTILDPKREIIKEGDVIKIAARSGRKEMHRYLFLFDDIMLLCNPKNSRGKYLVKAELDVKGLKLRDALHLKRPDVKIDQTILLKARQSALTLMFRTKEERESWEAAFIRAIGSDITDNQLFMNTVNLGNFQRIPTNFTAAPTWLPDSTTDSCMLCRSKFSALRRRHHCRGCGIVVDARCLKHKIRLPFADHQEKRVCDECYRHSRTNYPALVRQDTSLPDDDYN